MQQVYNKDGFVWWVGQVESTNDPLKIGRARCRIFGWHSTNEMELPTEELPWVSPMYPINNSKTVSAPKIGDWVVGFFLDGESGQSPVMMGVLPGLNPE